MAGLYGSRMVRTLPVSAPIPRRYIKRSTVAAGLVLALLTTACSSTMSGTATTGTADGRHQRFGRHHHTIITTTGLVQRDHRPPPSSAASPEVARRRDDRCRRDRRPLLPDGWQWWLPDRLLPDRSQLRPGQQQSAVDGGAGRHCYLGRWADPVQPRSAADDDRHRGERRRCTRHLRPAGRRVGDHSGRRARLGCAAGCSGHLRRSARPGAGRHLRAQRRRLVSHRVRWRLRRRGTDRRLGLVSGQRASRRHRDLRRSPRRSRTSGR